MNFKDTIKMGKQGVTMNLGLTHVETSGLAPVSGQVFIEARDAQSGEIVAQYDLKNLIVRDAGIAVARLLRNSNYPISGTNNGLRMLAVGTGATGNILSPDAPTIGQRRLNSELARKAFASTQYRDANGFAVSYETNIVDYTTVFSEAEAVGPWNEMALLLPASNNPAVTNPIPNGPGNYDPTFDVTGYDLMLNYLTFSVISKPSTAVFSVTWRITT
jgi:hypothetical protein